MLVRSILHPSEGIAEAFYLFSFWLNLLVLASNTRISFFSSFLPGEKKGNPPIGSLAIPGLNSVTGCTTTRKVIC
ncbi:hypothetical protein HOY80DRAFT_968613 [Tuber brumale]|nr:hypothetical protein HOY80DRAFT_968613 [Tuber brumale]